VGTVDFYLANKAAYILGLDLSQKAISICRASAKAIGVSGNTKFEVINQNIDTKFDFIICAEVIEHVVDDRQLLQKFSGILRKKGILFLSTPSVNAPLFRLHLANSFDKNVGHLRRYDEVKLKKMLNYANFKVLESRKTEGVLRNALFVVPSLNWIVKFLRGPLSDLVTLIDNFLVDIFGESNILIVAQKK
jgi:2-polyprenyl-3-methyl-5-hydroxy-6-metoxy-1,4-benzoquinol methylase